MGLLNKLKEGLTKTRKGLTEKIDQLIHGSAIDDELFDDLEVVLIQADVGVQTTAKIINELRQKVKNEKIKDSESLGEAIQAIITRMLGEGITPVNIVKPVTVIMVVGVNGVGKTTTIGKLGYYFKDMGLKVMLAAGDTFRAAAIDQLEIWGQRIGAEVIKHSEGANPGAVAFDAIQAAKARQADVLIIDTAGRLHTKANLMEELKKVQRVIEREMPGAPQEILLVLDATTGQNAMSQAKLFNEATQLSGLVLTKLDGTAKGGVVIAIQSELVVPIKFIGIGEGINDLRPFMPKEFSMALFDKN